ncbi:hypothetical protein FALBO_2306 [Fusarium albosuccineum]|uniref:Ubiquitin 3 binding protein But2 C-terminal domain-containing protein n=1 Tax=Fusarium albosuccineum TaxID=1237068 RepID=A0A8H4PHX6_9HYPO|nr:hypothetical protein FALBO_2306 [Fusarium albosuccineum]
MIFSKTFIAFAALVASDLVNAGPCRASTRDSSSAPLSSSTTAPSTETSTFTTDKLSATATFTVSTTESSTFAGSLPTTVSTAEFSTTATTSSTTSICVEPTNYVENPSFEDGTEPWRFSSSASVTPADNGDGNCVVSIPSSCYFRARAAGTAYDQSDHVDGAHDFMVEAQAFTFKPASSTQTIRFGIYCTAEPSFEATLDLAKVLPVEPVCSGSPVN